MTPSTGVFAAIVCVLQVLGVRSYTRGALWTATVHRPPTRLHGTGVPIEIAGANKKLYQDQQQAWTRRANVEKELLGAVQELHETKVVAAAARGTGFSASNTQGAVAAQWAASLKADGVIRVNACLTKDTAAALRAHVLCELAASKADILAARVGAREVMGQELERPYRDDYLLSLLAPPRSTTTDDVNNTDDVSPAAGHPMAAALNELFGDAGKLRSLYELIVTKQGLLYEMAVMVTTPGADRQMVHADMPYQREPPLYSIFVALQDVECDMGPTVFLKGAGRRDMQWHAFSIVTVLLSLSPTIALPRHEQRRGPRAVEQQGHGGCVLRGRHALRRPPQGAPRRPWLVPVPFLLVHAPWLPATRTGRRPDCVRPAGAALRCREHACHRRHPGHVQRWLP